MKIRLDKLILFLLITGGYWYRLFTAGNGILGHSYLYSIFALLVLLIVLFLPAFNRRFVNDISANSLTSITLKSYTVIFIYALISVLWAISSQTAMLAMWNYFTTGVIIIVTSLMIRSHEDINFACKICWVNVVIICAMALYEAFTGNYIIGYTSSSGVLSWVYSGLHSPIVQYNHPNNLSTTLLLSFPFCAIALNGGKRKHTILFVILSATLIVIFIAADSRMSLIVFALYFVLLLMQNGKIGNKVTVLFLFVLALMFLASIFETTILSRINISSLSGEARPQIWANAFRNFLSSYGIGVGAGNAQIANEMSATASYIGRPCHNYVLEILEELGVVGCISWLVWFVAFFKRAIKRNRSQRNIITANNLFFLILFVPLTVQQSSMLGSFSIWMLFGFSAAIDRIECGKNL